MKQPDKIVSMSVEKLIPYARNARTHSDAQVAQIAASMREFGWTNPVLVDGRGGIIAGHGRVLAARKLGIKDVPCIVLGHLSETQKRALILADNKLALSAGWDDELLRIEVDELKLEDFDLSLTGFDSEEIDALLAPPATEGLTDPDDVPELSDKAVSKQGDVWQLGRHRLMCGDSTNAVDVERLTGGVVPDLAICDPPYGVSIVRGGSVGGAKPFGCEHGRAKRAIIEPGTYAPIIGDDTTETAVKSHAVLVSIGVPAIVLWGGNYFANLLPPSRCWLAWDKENTGTFADIELAWTNQDAVARLFRHQWSGLIKASERGERRVHPTQKPVALADWVCEVIAPKAEKIIDLFLGGGGTLISAERKGKTLYAMEMAPVYVDVAIRRWEAFTGVGAIHAETGEQYPEALAFVA